MANENDIENSFDKTIISLDAFKQSKKQAEKMLDEDSPDQIEQMLKKLEDKLRSIPNIGDKLAAIPVFVSMIRSYVRKEYTVLPVSSAVAILAALLYFLSPVDLIPDAIPVVGLLDDAAVAAFVWTVVESDVKDYLAWRDGK